MTTPTSYQISINVTPPPHIPPSDFSTKKATVTKVTKVQEEELLFLFLHFIGNEKGNMWRWSISSLHRFLLVCVCEFHRFLFFFRCLRCSLEVYDGERQTTEEKKYREQRKPVHALQISTSCCCFLFSVSLTPRFDYRVSLTFSLSWIDF